jgi:hypothetical protein
MPATRGRPARVGRLQPVSPTLRPRVRPRAWRLEWSGGAASTGGLPAPGVFTVPSSARAASPAAKGVFPRQNVQTVSCHPDLANQTASASADPISVCSSNAAAAAATWSVWHRPHLHTADRLTSPLLPVPQPLVALDEGLCAFRHRRRATQLPRLHPAHPVHPCSPLPSSALLQSSGPLREPRLLPSSSPSASSASKHATPPTRTKLLVLSTHNHLRARVLVTRATRLPGPSLPLRAPITHAPPSSCASCPSMFPSSFLCLAPVLWSSA